MFAKNSTEESLKILKMLSSEPSQVQLNSAFSSVDQTNASSLVAQFALAASNAAKQNLFSNPLLMNQLQLMKNQLVSPLASAALVNACEDSEVLEMDQARDGDKSVRIQARLARNRTTARLRRERKKQQAENLTKQVTELKAELDALEEYLETMPLSAQAKVNSGLELLGESPVACMFCDLDFKSEDAKRKHVETDHSADLKARQSLQKASSMDEKRCNEPPSPGGGSKLSIEERKKRRLERNAASARLCRQRKKQYIENLRLQVPALRHRINGLRSLMPREALETVKGKMKEFYEKEKHMALEESKLCMSDDAKEIKIQGESTIKKVNIPRLSGWDSTIRRNSTIGYESGSSDSTAVSNKSKMVDEKKIVSRSPKRKRETEGEIPAVSPLLQSFSLPMGFLPQLSLSPLSLYGHVPEHPGFQQPDIFSAALALSNLGPISQKQS